MDSPYHFIYDRLFVHDSQCCDLASANCPYVPIAMDRHFSYVAFFEDFGPVNLVAVQKFCSLMCDTLNANPTKFVVVWGDNAKSFTNAAFLVGAYLIIEHGQSPEEIMRKFDLVSDRLLSYRDVSPGRQNFELHLQDCWDALKKAKDAEWINAYDYDEYEHYSNPQNFDLHVIVPDKLIAMAGPVSLPENQEYCDTEWGSRQFSPDYALEILQDFDVQAVLRLNEPEYDETILSQGGIAVVDLFFEDCSTPPPDVVLKFMSMVEHLDGPIAVHCKAGLGRTGTLIALYLMKHHEFTARQAIAWLRIVRPGSVIGKQQDFLCSQDKHMPRAREAFARKSCTSPPSATAEGLQLHRTIPRGAPITLVNETVAVVFSRVHRIMQAGHLLAGLPPCPSKMFSRPSAHSVPVSSIGWATNRHYRHSDPCLFAAAAPGDRSPETGTETSSKSDAVTVKIAARMAQSCSGSALSTMAIGRDAESDFCSSKLRRCKSDDSPYTNARLLAEHVAIATERRSAALARQTLHDQVRRQQAAAAKARMDDPRPSSGEL